MGDRNLRSATIASQPNTFGACMVCRGPFLPCMATALSPENMSLIRLQYAFTSINPQYNFMSGKKDAHVFQVKLVQPAILWTDRVCEVGGKMAYVDFRAYLQRGVGVGANGRTRKGQKDPYIEAFACPATEQKVDRGTTATWDAPSWPVRFPGLLGSLRGKGDVGRVMNLYEEWTTLTHVTYPVCNTCNRIMDSDAEQRALLSDGALPLVPGEAITIHKGSGEDVAFPQAGNLDLSRSYRHALLGYYLHRCLLGLPEADFDYLAKHDGFLAYTRMCYLALMIACKWKGVMGGNGSEVGSMHTGPQVGFYVSYLAWNLLRTGARADSDNRVSRLEPIGDRGGDGFDFARFHIMFALEAPRCDGLWPEGCERSLPAYVYAAEDASVNAMTLLQWTDAGVSRYVREVGMGLSCLMRGDAAGLTNWTDAMRRSPTHCANKVSPDVFMKRLQDFFVTPVEGKQLMALQRCMPCASSDPNKHNPGAFIRMFGCTTVLLPYYHHIRKEEELRRVVWDLLHTLVESEWTNLREANPGMVTEDTQKVAYNLAFSTVASEVLIEHGLPVPGTFREVLEVILRGFNGTSLSRAIKGGHLCSVWKASIRLMNAHACVDAVSFADEAGPDLIDRLGRGRVPKAPPDGPMTRAAARAAAEKAAADRAAAEKVAADRAAVEQAARARATRGGPTTRSVGNTTHTSLP